MKRKLKLVEVVWWDIASYGPNWHSEEQVDACEHVVCRSIGYLWQKNKDRIKLVDTVTDDGGLGNVNVILCGVIKELRTLDTITFEYQQNKD